MGRIATSKPPQAIPNYHTLLRAAVVGLFGLLSSTPTTPSVEPIPPNQVEAVTWQKEENQLLAIAGNHRIPWDQEIKFSHQIRVFPDGSYTVNDGAKRQLEAGEILDRNGRLTTPKGQVRPVFDHITKKQGQILIMRNGKYSPVTESIRLPSGLVVQPDGTLTRIGKRTTRMIDGQIIALDGTILPSIDTITLRDGQVYVQKNGSLLHIPPGRSIVMENGAKVFGKGTVKKMDGSTIQLQEGQILKVPGVNRKW